MILDSRGFPVLTVDGYVNLNGDGGAAHRAAMTQAITDVAAQTAVFASRSTAQQTELVWRICKQLRVVKDTSGQDHLVHMGRLGGQGFFWTVAPPGEGATYCPTTGNDRYAMWPWNETADGVEGAVCGIRLDVTMPRSASASRNYGIVAVVAGAKGNRAAVLMSDPVSGADMREPLELVEGNGNVEGYGLTVGPHGFFAKSKTYALSSFEMGADIYKIVWEGGSAWWRTITGTINSKISGT